MSQEQDHVDELVASGRWDTVLIRRLLGEAQPYAARFAVTFAILLAVFAFELIAPWILRGAIDGPVADGIAARADMGAAFDARPHVAALGLWAAAFLACTALTTVLRYFEVAHINETGQRVIAALRVKVFRHLQRLDVAYFDRRPTGALVTRVTTDIENLNEMFSSGLVVLLVELVKIFAVVAILFAIHPRLALFVLLLMPVLIGTSLVFRGGARRAHRMVRARLAVLNGYLQEVLQGIRVVQVFRRERRVGERFAGLLDDYLTANMRTILLFALFYPTLDFAVTIVQGAVVWSGGVELAGRTLTFGVFFQFWLYVNMLLNPVRQLGERYNVLQSALASAERVFQVLDTAPGIAPPTPAAAVRIASATGAGHVRFEAVSFSYTDDVEVLSDVSFEIAPGETVAVVGATGAGKSTLVNLLLRFYEPSRGRITVDRAELSQIDLASLRRHVGLVLQEDFLFTGSVRDNLVMARPEVTDLSLEAALVASRAEDLVARLPGQLAAPVAERGATFSTGERQLLAIARALAGQPRLVILDEATASVDSEVEARIDEAQRNLLSGRSALVIAHRLSTVRRADRILVMHRGRLREQGTHDELIAHGQIYARLHALQFAAPNAA